MNLFGFGRSFRRVALLVSLVYPAASLVAAGAKPAGTLESAGADVAPALRTTFIADQYKIVGTPGSGYYAWNVANGIQSAFSDSGIEIEAKGQRLRLTLAGFGWGGLTSNPGAVTQSTVNGARVDRVYASGLREWFVNDAQGLQQGFVIDKRQGTGRLTIRLAVDADWRVNAVQDDVVFSHAGVRVDYSGLKAWDAHGIAAPARMRAQGREVVIEIDDSDAFYPLFIDPVYTQQQEFTASDANAGDAFGISVSLSGDGLTALVGASYKTVGANTHQGAAYVYTRTGAVWTQQQKLTASDGVANDYFGRGVLSGDGLTAVIGAPSKKVGANQQGAAYVFVRSGPSWSQQQELIASDGAAGDGFGSAIALSSDGTTVLVGASGKAIGARNGQGAVYVFARVGTVWVQQAELTAADGTAGDAFGSSAALSNSASMAIIGAFSKTIGANVQQGAAYVFARSGTAWSQQAVFTASDGAEGDHFGSSAALSGDGLTALIGANNKTVSGTPQQGVAYVFALNGTTWSQQQELVASDGGAGDYLGYSTALSSDGATALVGAIQNTVYAQQGAAYLFIRNGTAWSQQQKLTVHDGAPNDQLGFSVALSGDGSTALVGSPGHTLGQGAADVFVTPTKPIWTVTNTNDSGPGSLRDAITSAGAGDTINFSLSYPATITLTSGTLSIGKNLTVNGPGLSNLTISGNRSTTVISVATGANVNISGVTIASGGSSSSSSTGSGGGISNAGNLTITNSSVSGNSAGRETYSAGGGIDNSGLLTMIACSVLNNTAISGVGISDGGGIYNTGAMVISGSVVSGNSASVATSYCYSGDGGGIYNSGTLAITNSILEGNRSGASGGAIYNDGMLTLTSSTLSGNSVGSSGSGCRYLTAGAGVYNAGALILTNSTLPGNSCSGPLCAGAGLYNIGHVILTHDTFSANAAAGGMGNGNGILNGGTLTIKGTILANGTGNCGLSGSNAISAGYNLSDDTSCLGFLNNTGDLNNTPAGLDPKGLQDNGGPTPTIALLPASPAVDAIPATSGGYCTATDGTTAVLTDQRSLSRPQGTGCDIGAFELTTTATVLTITTYHTSSVALGQQATYIVTVSNAVIAGPSAGAVSVTDTLPNGTTLLSMTGIGWSCAFTTCTRGDTLPPGASYPPIVLTVNVSANAVSPLINTATVSGGGAATASTSESAIIAGVAILSVAKTHTGSFALGQQGATYTLIVSNSAGAGPTSGTVTVSDNLPSGLSLVSMAGSGWSCTGNTCTRADVLAAGASYPPITVTVNVAAHATSPQINTATVSGGGWATSSASDWTTITGVPILSVTKAHAGNFTLGQQGTYTIAVSNTIGAGPTSGTVTVSDILPNGLSLALIGGTGWTCQSNTCSRSDVLAAGASYPAITATVNVAAHATSPQVNSVTVSGGGSATAAAVDSTTIIGVPILSIAKTHNGSFGLGQQGATYILMVSNAAGAGPTSGTVSVTDTLPSGLGLVSMAGSGWACSSNNCTRNDVLAAGASYPQILVAVNVASNATSPQVNYAAVSGGGSVTASASDSTTIIAPSLSIAKTHAGNFTQGQQSATYKITVSNASGAGPTGGTVSVTDNLPNGLTLVSMAGTGWSCASITCTRNDALAQGNSYPPITVAVNVSSMAPSSVTNTAVVSGGGSPASSASDPTNISPPLYTLSGSVTVAGVGLSGVTVTLTGTFSGNTVTNASGNYSFGGLYGGGTYTLTAALAGYSFTAPITFSNLSSNQTANFTGISVGGLTFFPVTPCRLVDTRVASFQSGFGPPSMSAASTRTFAIPSNTGCGIPASASAYAVNVTVVTKGYLGYLSIWPTGQPIPNVSTLNSYSSTSTAVANAAIVPAGANGAINVYVTDATDLIIDVDGYFAPPPAQGLVFYPVTPCRLVDTRVSAFQSGFGPPTMPAGGTRSFPIPTNTACQIPAAAQAYSMNVTAVPQKTLGFLSIWPAGKPLPNVSTLNVYTAGTVVANAAIVPAGTNGAISAYVTDQTDLVIDINGYFAAPGNGLKFYPVTPCRVADTRVASFPAGLGPPYMGAGTQRPFPIPQSTCGIPTASGAYSFNFTAVPQAPQLGIFTTWPTGVVQPNVSTMNSYNGSVVANAAIVPAGAQGAISIYVTDATDVLFDINGYFAP